MKPEKEKRKKEKNLRPPRMKTIKVKEWERRGERGREIKIILGGGGGKGKITAGGNKRKRKGRKVGRKEIRRSERKTKVNI